MQFYYYFLIVLLGFLFSYQSAIMYVKCLRNGDKRFTDLTPILVSIIFGGPVLLLTYMFKEIRDVDKTKKYRYLISGIVLTVLQATLTGLLIGFGAVIF